MSQPEYNINDLRCYPCQLENNTGLCDRKDCINSSQHNREKVLAVAKFLIENFQEAALLTGLYDKDFRKVSFEEVKKELTPELVKTILIVARRLTFIGSDNIL